MSDFMDASDDPKTHAMAQTLGDQMSEAIKATSAMAVLCVLACLLGRIAAVLRHSGVPETVLSSVMNHNLNIGEKQGAALAEASQTKVVH